jgi:hypothetical protein
MKPGSKDIKAFLKFTEGELELLQDNTWQMAETFGLDRRIDELTGKRKVGFYMWDLESIEMVVTNLKNQNSGDKKIVNDLFDKIKEAMDYLSFQIIRGKNNEHV